MRKHGIAALLTASALLLTACRTYHYENYSESYPDYLAYSLGSDYHLTKGETEQTPEGFHVCHWDVQYTQKNTGAQRSFRLDTYDYQEYDLDQSFGSAEQFNDYYLLSALYPEANKNAMLEFGAAILSRYFRYQPSESDSSIVISPETNVTFSAQTRFMLPAKEEALRPLTEAALRPESGLQVCTASLRSIAQDKTLIPVFSLRIAADKDGSDTKIDPAPYLENMERIYQDYLRAAEAPENYRFSVIYVYQDSNGKADPETENILFDKAALTGIGEFDPSERYQVKNSEIEQKMQDELREILTQQPG